MTQYTIAQALQYGVQTLTHSDSAKLDSEILLLKVLNGEQSAQYHKTWLMTWPEKRLTEQQLQQFSHYLQQRSEGMPVAYITGEQGFWTLTLKVTPATLIPRPETELLVECALQKIPDIGKQKILDLGTGSGAIALAIAAERSNAHIIASDISLQALDIAKKNARDNAAHLATTNITFYHSHWLENIQEQQFDVIVSNPPYIAKNDPLLETNVRKYEPLGALLAGATGLDDIADISEHCQQYLKSGGWLLFEHAHDQAPAVQNILQHHGFKQISSLDDLNYHPRVTMAQKS